MKVHELSSRFGVPEKIVSDNNASQLTLGGFKNFYKISYYKILLHPRTIQD